MKHYIILLFTAMLTFAVSSCDIETSGNGDLDGMWHLVSVDTLATSMTTDMGGEMIFWSFQGKLLQLDDKSKAHHSVLMRFVHSGGTLTVNEPYLYDREEGDKPMTDLELLSIYGVNALEEVFRVENLSGGKMILCNDRLRLCFKKM